jgi:hypothetical protein
MASRAEEREARYESVKVKVWAVKGPRGQLHIQSEIQPLGATLVTVVYPGSKTEGGEFLFTTWEDVKAFVVRTITAALEEGRV